MLQIIIIKQILMITQKIKKQKLKIMNNYQMNQIIKILMLMILILMFLIILIIQILMIQILMIQIAIQNLRKIRLSIRLKKIKLMQELVEEFLYVVAVFVAFVLL